MNIFNVLIVGEKGVGKNTFCSFPFVFFCDKENTYAFNIKKTEGDFTLQDIKHADGIFFMYDITNRDSYKFICNYVKHICSNIELKCPLLLIGNKQDSWDRKVHTRQVNLHREFGLKFFEISAQQKYNISDPFLYLTRTLLKNENIHFANKQDVKSTL